MLRIHCQDVYGSSIILYVGNKKMFLLHLAYLVQQRHHTNLQAILQGVYELEI